MKVLMLGWEFPPIISGGLGTYLYNFTRELSQKVDKIYFLMPGAGTDTNLIKLEFPGNSSKFELISLNVEGFNPYSTTSNISINSETSAVPNSVQQAYGMDFFSRVNNYTTKAMDAAKNLDFDIIHAHDWMTFPAATKIAEISNKPLVVTIHSTEYDRGAFLSMNNGIIEIEKKGLEKANKVITVSNRMKNELMDYYSISENKIKVVYNGTQNTYEKPNSRDPNMVLFVGRLTIQKGCDYFLHAAKMAIEKNPNLKFVIVGQGDMLPQLIQQSIDLGISKNVFFTGFETDVSKYYSNAGLFVMPSVSEPFGLTAVEAISKGIPTIISKQSGSAEIITHAFKTDFWDTREMANKILGLTKYSPLNVEMSNHSYNESKGLPSWENVAQRTLNVYFEAM